MEKVVIESLPFYDRMDAMRAQNRIQALVDSLKPTPYCTDEHLQCLEEMKEYAKKVDKTDIESYEEHKKRVVKKVERLFGRFWKMTTRDQEGNEAIQYIMPYKYLSSNEVLFSLRVCPLETFIPEGEIFYMSGVQEYTFNLFERLESYTLIFEEITKEEFIKMGKESVDKIVEHYLNERQ